MAIKSFQHRGLERFFLTGTRAGIQAAHARKLSRLLTALNVATAAGQMNLPGFGFHALKGDMAGFYSVWVNGNWRVIFTFQGTDAFLVDYLDYH